MWKDNVEVDSLMTIDTTSSVGVSINRFGPMSVP